jgi:hypothetical protein
MLSQTNCRVCSLPKVDEYFDYAIVWPAQRHTMKKAVNFLQDSDVKFDLDRDNECVIVDVTDADAFITAFNNAITQVEADDTRVLMCGSKIPRLGDFKNIVSLSHLVDRISN